MIVSGRDFILVALFFAVARAAGFVFGYSSAEDSFRSWISGVSTLLALYLFLKFSRS